MGTVSGGGVNYTAPVLVEDMNKDYLTAVTMTKTYDGTASDSVVQRLSYGVQPVSGVTAASASANVGSSLANPIVSGLVAPGEQNGTAYFLQPGILTIAPQTLSVNTTATKTYNGNNILGISSSDTSISGIIYGQSASITGSLDVSLASSNAGQNIGGTINLSGADLLENASFSSALSHGDYILPTGFSGGTITPKLLTISTSATKTFDGNNNIVLDNANTTISGTIPGQTADMGSTMTGLLYSIFGKDIGGTWTGTFPMTGNSAFLAALAVGDYKWAKTFFGGSVVGGNITPKASSVAASSDQVECLGTYCTQKPPQKPGKKDRYHDVPLPLSFIEIIHMKNGGVRLPDDILETSPYTILGTWPKKTGS